MQKSEWIVTGPQVLRWMERGARTGQCEAGEAQVGKLR